LRPAACALASAGKQPAKVGARASGAWRGSIADDDAIGAASRLAPLLASIVQLDGCGTFADADLSGSSLRFRRLAQWEEDEEACGKAAEVLGGKVTALRLAGNLGQILTHSGDLWLRSSGTTFDALLVLRPLQRASTGRARSFAIGRPGPMGFIEQRWEEVALIELPRLMRLTMDDSTDRRAAALVKVDPGKFLVDEEEDIIKICCWQRVAGDGSIPPAASPEAMTLEQLQWYNTIAALGETSPCAEAAVPMKRVELVDEGIGSREELLGEFAQHDVPKEDAPRLASVTFLRQFVDHEVMLEEVLPRLFPTNGTMRVISAGLAAKASLAKPHGQASSGSKPKTLDDLFSDDLDFRKPSPWAAKSVEEDPLAHHELTSVHLLNDSSGFLLSFHCLQGVDPLAA